MSPSNDSNIRFLAVGGNAVSAFLSWRLQATNACDVTLVWKNNFENVAQYGISFRYVVVPIGSSGTELDGFATLSARGAN
jgi:hypothetical protein